MPETSADQFRANLKEHVDECIENHEVLHVRRKKGPGFVVLGEDDWRSIEETLYLNQFPGLVKSIHKAEREPLSKGTRLKDLKW